MLQVAALACKMPPRATRVAWTLYTLGDFTVGICLDKVTPQPDSESLADRLPSTIESPGSSKPKAPFLGLVCNGLPSIGHMALAFCLLFASDFSS